MANSAAAGDAWFISDTLAHLPAAHLLINDTDPDGDVLSVTTVGAAINGTVSLATGTVSFAPGALAILERHCAIE
jgi:hypothetical protein